SLAGAFGGLLATTIGKMGGVGGYSSWRWVFILEGLITVVISVFLYFITSDFPEEVKWLAEEEKAFIKQRFSNDVGDSGHCHCTCCYPCVTSIAPQYTPSSLLFSHHT
ncbi:hypothetical protein BDM02DRAFT_3105140, partial [Thelephora ganbajun]